MTVEARVIVLQEPCQRCYHKPWQGVSLALNHQTILDPTQLGIQSASVSTEDWLQWLTETFAQVGLEQPPEYVSEHQANSLTWRLYLTEFNGNSVDIALAESDTVTMLVVMVSDPGEREALYEAVYIPVIDALTPIQ